MDMNQIFQLVFWLLVVRSNTTHCTIIDVMNYGAVGNGIIDDSLAFSKAWAAACGGSSSSAVLEVPKGKKFMLNSFTFQGPCKPPSLNFKVEGEIIAPSKITSWKRRNIWLAFNQVDGLTVNGNGLFDGQGSVWWKIAGRGVNHGPTALAFQKCNNLTVSGLTHKNSPRNHISITSCTNAIFTDLHIVAPEDSHNTDGIDISHSSYVQILDSIIGTGDDCIAINGGCKHINISGLTCGPGHGISIGSLGRGGDRAEVDGVTVRNCTFKGTQNGARIKTWRGGSGFARNIVYQDITLVNVHNPIIIDQNYCGLPNEMCTNSNVEVSDISFGGFRGTSTSEKAINLSCSKGVGCTKILLQHINITAGIKVKTVGSSCINAHGKSIDSTPRVDCLLP